MLVVSIGAGVFLLFLSCYSIYRGYTSRRRSIITHGGLVDGYEIISTTEL